MGWSESFSPLVSERVAHHPCDFASARIQLLSPRFHSGLFHAQLRRPAPCGQSGSHHLPSKRLVFRRRERLVQHRTGARDFSSPMPRDYLIWSCYLPLGDKSETSSVKSTDLVGAGISLPEWRAEPPSVLLRGS